VKLLKNLIFGVQDCLASLATTQKRAFRHCRERRNEAISTFSTTPSSAIMCSLRDVKSPVRCFYFYHGRTVVAFTLGLLLIFSPTTLILKPSEEEEREQINLFFITAGPCRLSAGLGNLALIWFCFGFKSSFGGEKTLRELL